MATRVNTKFVLILTGTVFTAAAVFGGLMILQIRGDTSRHIRAGDELMVLGQYEQAMKLYGRAVSKEPANVSHLRKLEAALLSIRPETQDEANEFDTRRMEILRHDVRYHRQDPEPHLRLLTELHRLARWFDQADVWDALNEASEDMYESVPSTTAERNYALLYRGMSAMRVMGLYGVGAVPPRTAAVKEIDEAEKDLVQFKDAFPDNDLGWATLAESQLAIARQLRVEGLDAAAKKKSVEADETIGDAKEAVPDGPEIARVEAMRLALRRYEDNDLTVDAELTEAIDRMVKVATASDNPMLLWDVGRIVRRVEGEQGLERSVQLVENYVQANPDKHFQRFLLASLAFVNRDYDKAQEAAEAVIASEYAPVSMLSRIQPTLRIRSAGIIFDIEYRRWRAADVAEKAAQLERAEDALKTLAYWVADTENQPQLLRAEGKLALARSDFATAAARFEKVLEISPVQDFETLLNAARALEQIGQLGIALNRIVLALEGQPANIALLAEKARLEYRTGEYADAKRSIAVAQRIEEEQGSEPNAMLGRLKTAIDASEAHAASQEASDTTAIVLLQVEAAVEEGNLDLARTTLESALAETDDPLPLITELVQIEIRAGRTEEARAHVEEALAIQPANTFLLKLKASLDNEDQIEALKAYLAGIHDDEADLVVNTYIHMQVLAREMERLAERSASNGDEESAQRTRERAVDVQAEADTYLDRAQQLAPDHPTLLEHLFNSALADGDLTKLRELVERARAVDADKAGGLIYEGRLELFEGKWEEAVQTLAEATDRKHYSSLAWRLLGRAQEQLGNFGQAIRAYEEAYKCNPRDRFAVRWYAGLLMQTGDRTRALRVLRSARHSIASDIVLQEARLMLEAEEGNLTDAVVERRVLYERAPGNRVNAMQLAALLGSSETTREHVTDDNGLPKYAPERWKNLSEEERAEKLREFATAWWDRYDESDTPDYDTGQWTLLSEKERQQELDQVTAAWRWKADEIISALEADEPDSLEITALRAQMLRVNGDVDGGEKILADYCRRHADDPSVEALLVLGVYQLDVKKLGAGLATFESARPYQSEEREADGALADAYFTHNMWARAYELYHELASLSGERDDKLRLVECCSKLNRLDEASTLLEEVVGSGGDDYFTAMLTAGIAEGKGDALYVQNRLEEADREYEKVDEALAEAQRQRPGSALPHIRRAQRLLKAFHRTEEKEMVHLDDALLHLDRAEQAASGAEAIRRVRIEILRARGETGAAIGELTRVLASNPDNIAARRLLLQLYTGEKREGDALKSVEEAIAQHPTFALWHEARGDLLVRLRQFDEAVAAFRRACELEPNGNRLAKYAEIAFMVEDPDLTRVADQIASNTERLDGSPLLRNLYARVLASIDRPDEALEQLRLAYAEHAELLERSNVGRTGLVTWLATLQVVMTGRDAAEYEQFVRELAGEPDPLELHWIARTWVTRGAEGLKRARELVRLALEKTPADDTRLRADLALDLGQFEVLADNLPAAVAAFEMAIELDPGNVLALNNAAYIYSDRLGEPEKAVPLAEQAAVARPDDATVLDTLGWTYYRVARYEDAEDALRRSINIEPLAENHLHLAHVLFAKNEVENSQRYLIRAGDLRPSEVTQKEIDELTRQIELRMRGAGP